MKIFRAFLLLAVLSFLTGSIYAQKTVTQTADDAFKYKQYYEAAELYKKAYPKVKNKVEKRRILFQIAECYRFSNQVRRAEAAYKRAVKSGYSDPIIHLRYGDILRILEEYDLALEQFEAYKAQRPDDIRGEYGIQSCKIAKEWIDNPTKYVVEPIKKINSKTNDFSPVYADKKKKAIVFTSDRDDATGRKSDAWTGGAFTDLFVTSQDRLGNWSIPVLVDESGTVNTDVNEGTAFFDDKVNTIYFSRCPIEKKTQMGCQIYVASKKGKGWGEAEKLELAADSFVVTHPCLDPKEKEIYFSSNMPGGYGGMDIWVARRTRSNKPFGKPENLGPKVNTPGHEVFPYLRQDGVLYFSSDGNISLGGLDILRTELTAEGWSQPENLRYPINSSGDDFGIIFEGHEQGYGKEEKGYFTTNRKGGRGGDDIWSLYLAPIIFTLEGTVRDDSTLQLIPGASITFSGSDGTLLETKTDEKGRYSFNKEQILPLTSYTLRVQKEKYFGADGKVTTVGEEKSRDFILNFRLTPIPVEPVVLPEIQYALNDTFIIPSFLDSLNDLINTMNSKPTLVVELIAHTDFRATNEYNDELSLGRARYAVWYLVSKGIDPDRLIAKGKGENEPRTLKSDITTTGQYGGITFKAGTKLNEAYINSLRTTKEKEAAHQLNRRTEFRVVRDDFVPKATNDTIVPESFEIKINPNEDVIDFRLGAKNEILMKCIANGLSYEFNYDSSAVYLRFSQEEAQKLLRNARITKSDFKEGEEAINEDGTIKDGSIFYFDRVTFGIFEHKDVEAIVDYNQKLPLVAGDHFLKLFGDFKIDRAINAVIFK
jgi:peptidoglycan-associated lipoprotein